MEKVERAIQKFIQEKNYLGNEHCLGIFFYGSYLTGLYNQYSDIDLHVVFDDSNPLHLFRGSAYQENLKIEYFEKPLQDLYLSIQNSFFARNVAWYSIIGTSKILFDKKGELQKL